MLKLVLKGKYASLLPLLDAAVRRDPESPGPWESKTDAREQAKGAKTLERALQRCLDTLDQSEVVVQAAQARGYLPSGPSLGDLLDGASNIPGGRQMSGPWWETRVSVIEALLQDVTTWQRRAHADGRLKRGRKVGDRILLAEWVGLRLDDAGIRLTVSADGTWAHTLAVVYEAAQSETIPQDLFRDVQRAYQFLQDAFPERFPHRTKVLHKRPKNSAV